MGVLPRVRSLVTVVLLVAGACSDGTAVTTTHTLEPTTSTTPTSTSTTEAGTSAPPTTSTTSTTTIPLVTTFDERTECDPAAEDLDVLRMQAFVAAYNDRDLDRLLDLVTAESIWDATGIPHVGDIISETMDWAEAGWAVSDELRLLAVRSYSRAGADGMLERRNDLLDERGLGWVAFPFKAHGRQCRIPHMVLYGAGGHGDISCDFYRAFEVEYQAAGHFPDECLYDVSPIPEI